MAMFKKLQMKLRIGILIISIFSFQQCASDAPSKKGSIVVNHQQWTTLLQKHVDKNGMVNYKGFQNDSLFLQAYLNDLSINPPDENSWTNEDQIAYWINLYNAFTLQLIINHYPLKSIKDIGSAIQIPFINSPWDIKFIRINGKKLDLNNIEHAILRKKFNEPRMHFAINCASISCPKLRREAYTGKKLHAQLNEQAILFINDSTRNNISNTQANISKIFRWFKGDFTKKGSLIVFLNKYSNEKLDQDADINFMDYNWTLNELSEIK